MAGKLFGNFAAVLSITVDSTGAYAFLPDSLPQVMTYNGPNGKLDTVTVGPDPDGNYFRQTMTYTGENVTGVSAWVKVEA